MADGQQVYVTGDPIALGSWEPEVAVLLSPTTEEATMWKAEIKVDGGNSLSVYLSVTFSFPSLLKCNQPNNYIHIRKKLNTRIMFELICISA